MIETICRHCVFAEFNNPLTLTQTGCKLGRLKKFEEKKAYLSWHRDGDVESRKIDRFCNALRTPEWAKGITDQGRNLQEELYKEIALKINVIVPFSAKHTLEELITTVNSIEKQKHKVNCVYIINGVANISSSTIIDELKKLGESLNWNIYKDLYNESENTNIDIVVKQFKDNACEFYSIFYPGYEVPTTFTENLNKAINYNMDRFVFLEPSNGQGMTVSKKTHNFVGGNRPATHKMEDGTEVQCDSVESKIRMLAKDTNTSYMIKKALYYGIK